MHKGYIYVKRIFSFFWKKGKFRMVEPGESAIRVASAAGQERKKNRPAAKATGRSKPQSITSKLY
jgi:hypothetical protein